MTFYYPLSESTQYADVTGGLADATSVNGGTIAAESDMPLGSGFFTFAASTAGTNRYLALPSTALVNAGSADWTFEFRLNGDDWITPAFTNYGILNLTRSAAGPGSWTVPYISMELLGQSGGIRGFYIRLRGAGGTEQVIDTRSNFQGQNTGTFYSVYDISTETGTRYFSFTRNGNNLYFHIDGTLIATLDVTGVTFDFSGGGSPHFEMMGGTSIDASGPRSFAGTLGEVRWTASALYSSADYTPPDPSSPSSDSSGSEEFRLRAWGFELDGHSFYILRLGQTGTWVYDRLTGQWAQWITDSLVNWDASVGGNWNSYVIAGALDDSYIWSISPEQSLDSVGVVFGGVPITRTVTGLVSTRGRDRKKVGAVRVTASVGATDISTATMSLRFSDDYGVTFSSPISISMSATDTYEDLSFRSLGTIRSPGRVFEITDVGGATRIDDAVIEVI